jgi:SET domain-containing protein
MSRVRNHMSRHQQRSRESYIAPRNSRYRLLIDKSTIHGTGIFAEEAIPRGRKVIEYMGQRLTWAQAARLERKLERRGAPKNDYLAQLNHNWIINGAVRGSGAELINHSCKPNLTPRRIRGRLFFFSRRKIRSGEELTVDYAVGKDAPRRVCRCGAVKCRGTMNLK